MRLNNISSKAVILISLLLFSTTLIGQPARGKKTPPKPPNMTQISRMVDELSTSLALSPAQEKKISKLFNQHFTEMSKQLGQKRSTQPPSRASMDAKRVEFEAEVKTLLNKEQVLNFEKFFMSHGPQSQPLDQRR